MLLIEVLCVLLIVAGTAMWSVPAALIVGGALGVVACERHLAGERGGDS